MKAKAILLTGAIALVIVSCVVAAGCTSSTTTPQQASSGEIKEITGNWFGTYTFNGTTYDVIQSIQPDSTGSWVVIDDSRVYDTYTSTFSNFDGNGHFDKKSSDGNTYKMTYADGTLTEELGNGAGTIVYTKMDPILGQWTVKYQKDGKTVDAVMIISNDGNGYWMTLGDVDGIQLTSIYIDTWKKTGENTYQITSGKVYETVYNATTDTLTTESDTDTRVYTRLEPIVGIWYSTLAGEKSNAASHLFKPDGTGVATVVYDDGTANAYQMTWQKNSDGTYAITYPDGDKVTYSIDATGNIITTGSGATKTKLLYRGMTFISSIIGAWYDKDNDISYVFNADGTGLGVWKNGLLPFTWKLNDNSNYEVTYTGGTWDDGTDAKGKVTEWTYDGDTNEFISSIGIRYIRPAETVNGKITLYSI